VIVALAMLALGAEMGRVLIGANFHVVIPGEIFRCAQPTPEFLAWAVREHGIRTVVNLRGIGDGPIVDWYEREAAACQELGLSLENLTFSAYRLPNVNEVRRLLEVLDRSEKPVLIHCRRGADRTGMAAAIALLSQTDTPYAEARASLGLRYGHWALGSAGRLEAFFDEYENWLRDHRIRHDKTVFRRWVANGYAGGPCSAEIVDVRPPSGPIPADTAFAYRITYRNASRAPWRFSSIQGAGIHVGVVALDLGTRRVYPSTGGLLDRAVAPGESIELTALVPPLPPGRYCILIDLKETGHAWFEQVGSVPLQQEVTIGE
jgi:protein tyrosine phosphatase (PTP) superfamily phosphohydrolase (DUF442 family)